MVDEDRRVSVNEFVAAWYTCGTLSDVCEKLGKSRKYCVTRRYGVNAWLKKGHMEPLGRKPDMGSSKASANLSELLDLGYIRKAPTHPDYKPGE